ncbi:MAG: aminotransferase class V-fold PLP-dependent enzyme [Calditrichales bacterium]|nr:MAG: aminotransferase class V-fold PLP-dependent enzyme [Calditrichales bacterium]
MKLSDYRQYFPICETDIYLNHAAVSPLSTRVHHDLQDMVTKRSQGPIEVFPEFLEIKKELKSNLARLVDGEVEQIAIIGNTSEGFNWLVNGLEWQEGDRVLLVENEFPANIYPFLNLESSGVIIDYVPVNDGLIYLEDIEKNIHPRTRLLSISFVEFLSGFRNQLVEIGKICREKGIIFSVDSIQGLGGMPLSVRNAQIDFLSNGGHKWLMGLQGCGFMYVAPRLMNQLKPAFVGWLSVKDSWNFFDYRLDFLDDAGRFEIATPNLMGMVGLRASTGLLLEAGIGNIAPHLLDLGERMITGMSEIGYRYIGSQNTAERSGIYSFNGPDTVGMIKYLKENHIHISLRNEVLRFSPHFYNTPAEIDEMIHICKRYKAL